MEGESLSLYGRGRTQKRFEVGRECEFPEFDMKLEVAVGVILLATRSSSYFTSYAGQVCAGIASLFQRDGIFYASRPESSYRYL
jgi:hypothetical protein